jgi:hypothetical protein
MPSGHLRAHRAAARRRLAGRTISGVDWDGWLLNGVTCLRTPSLENSHLVP